MRKATDAARSAVLCDKLARPLIRLGVVVGQLSSWLVLFVMLSVLATVVLNTLGLNEIIRWEGDVLLLGDAITINSMTELQWHFFGVLTLLGATYALHRDSHVRVDLVYHNLSPRARAIVDVIGHVVCLIPFCLIIAWLSMHSVRMAYISGEMSNYGGLSDRYLIKAMLPIGLVFLAIGAVGQLLAKFAIIIDPINFGHASTLTKGLCKY
ncbi:TRAP transporter small permease subunit [Granulosicoccus antarcticus]|uniref:TRAP transporter small permease protein n=1 Tax=Granulosicoccus antarcticus IMCC3135 TaxID=1192854 RepID=A0A2Z2P1M1_9GAMM|nr:TRAP transporter small permease subunit [Granulosicoccus antarcticus]ASJ73504.1 hypothetical protein IMCC3135_17110 [Granulosicoccus antarcticus IMCC3135]